MPDPCKVLLISLLRTVGILGRVCACVFLVGRKIGGVGEGTTVRDGAKSSLDPVNRRGLSIVMLYEVQPLRVSLPDMNSGGPTQISP